MKKLGALVCVLIIFSCNKNHDITQTFTGNLPIVSTRTPATIAAGQDIITNIRCELGSLSGTVYFRGFDITTTSGKQFNITAKALYKDWNTQIGSPVMWTLDTSASIKTTTAGKYILNFYNATILFKSDTVQVN